MKSERVTFRLEESQHTLLRKYALSKGIDTSKALRQIISKVVKAGPRM